MIEDQKRLILFCTASFSCDTMRVVLGQLL